MLDPTLAIRIAIGLYRFMQRRIQVIGSSDWPMAGGKVTNRKIVRDDLLGRGIEFTYFYVAMGEYYSGTYSRAFRRKRSAEAFAERFPQQTAIPVRYKSEEPEISTLLLSDLTLQLAGLWRGAISFPDAPTPQTPQQERPSPVAVEEHHSNPVRTAPPYFHRSLHRPRPILSIADGVPDIRHILHRWLPRIPNHAP